jgi:chromosome segregation ATPase
MEKQMSELRSQLNVKAFEVERYEVSNLEINQNLSQCKEECNVLRKKVEVLKSEYYSLQTLNNKKIIDLEAKANITEQQLNQYKQLEKEIDLVIDHYTPSEDENSIGKENLIGQVSSLVPTKTSRRLRYCLYLARQVSDLEKNIQNKNKELNDKVKQNELQNQQLNKLKKHLQRASQPYNYLVTSIENREEQIDQLTIHKNKIEKQMKNLKKSNQKYKDKNKILEKDIQQLLKQSKETEKLKSLIVELKKNTS